jgi:hypothetical protein
MVSICFFLSSSKPSFFHDDNRANLFEVEPDSAKLLNADIQVAHKFDLMHFIFLCSYSNVVIILLTLFILNPEIRFQVQDQQ